MHALTEARIQASDRRLAAIHEAGHAIVIQHVGIRWFSASLFSRNAEVQAAGALDTKRWVGRVQLLGDPRSARLSRHRRAMIGVAGMVAEQAWRMRRAPEDFVGITWSDVLADPDCMSPTDWQAAGCSPEDWGGKQIRACEAVASLFDPTGGSNWPALLITARKLMRGERVEGVPPLQRGR